MMRTAAKMEIVQCCLIYENFYENTKKSVIKILVSLEKIVLKIHPFPQFCMLYPSQHPLSPSKKAAVQTQSFEPNSCQTVSASIMSFSFA